MIDIDIEALDSLNVEQAAESNKGKLSRKAWWHQWPS